MFFKKLGQTAIVCFLLSFPSALAAGQTLAPSDLGDVERLVVAEGSPLQIILTGKVRFKRNQPVKERVVQPVFAFDREVIPAGSEVIGHITGFKSGPRLVRITSMLGGNFTPVREP